MIYSHWNFQHGSGSKPRYPWYPKIDAYWIVFPANIVIIGFDPSPPDGISTHVQCLDVPNLEIFWANLWMVPGLPAMWRGDESFPQMLSARKPLGDGAEPDGSSQEMWNADFDPGIAPKCRRSFLHNSGKHTKNYGKWPFLMDKSTINKLPCSIATRLVVQACSLTRV